MSVDDVGAFVVALAPGFMLLLLRLLAIVVGVVVRFSVLPSTAKALSSLFRCVLLLSLVSLSLFKSKASSS